MVDAMLHYIAKAGAKKGSGWTRAKIGKIEDDTLHLEYPTEPRSADRSVDRWSIEIAELGSKTDEFWSFKAAIQPEQ